MSMIKLNKICMMALVLVLTLMQATNAHTPGPDYIYECTKCKNLLKKGSNASGNSLGSTLYSDARMIAPMLLEFPNFTKCQKCNTVLWLSEMKEIGTCGERNKNCKLEWKYADRARFLDVKDLFRFLEMDIVKNDKVKEKIVRQQIWWTFNDRVRANKEIFIDKGDEILWEQNCRRLIELFDVEDVNQKIMKAELHRNLGEFETCMELINSLDKSFDWLTDKFKEACDNRNKGLIILR